MYSGAFLSMVKLATLMQEKYGHTVLVILPYEGNGKKLLDDNGIRSIVIRSDSWVIPLQDSKKLKTSLKQIKKIIRNVIAIYEIAQVINREGIDIVHNNTSYGYVGAVAALHSQTPLIWHIREFLEEDQGNCIWRKKNGYKLVNRADRIILISNGLYKKYSKLLNPQKLTVVHNGIDPQVFIQENHIIFNTDTIHFLIVGGINEGKRQEDIVQACLNLLTQGFNQFVLIIAGNNQTAYASKIIERVKKAGAEKYIKIIGPVNNPETLYVQTDITFMCSTSEAFGRVTVEAMLSGSLVIGARSAGTVDIIQDGETGLLYQPGDIDDLISKIMFAIHHPDVVRQIAKTGQSTALKCFTASRNAEAVNNIYHSVMEEHKK